MEFRVVFVNLFSDLCVLSKSSLTLVLFSTKKKDAILSSFTLTSINCTQLSLLSGNNTQPGSTQSHERITSCVHKMTKTAFSEGALNMERLAILGFPTPLSQIKITLHFTKPQSWFCGQLLHSKVLHFCNLWGWLSRGWPLWIKFIWKSGVDLNRKKGWVYLPWQNYELGVIVQFLQIRIDFFTSIQSFIPIELVSFSSIKYKNERHDPV